jgi:acetyl-CoA synthetase
VRLQDACGPAEAAAAFSWEALWSLFDGDEERLNIAHECVDRHDPGTVAGRIAHSSGGSSEFTFGELSVASSQVAHLLEGLGVLAGQPVGVMMEPSLAFYATVFGALKHGTGLSSCPSTRCSARTRSATGSTTAKPSC